MATAYDNAAVVLEAGAMLALLARERQLYRWDVPQPTTDLVDGLHDAMKMFVCGFERDAAEPPERDARSFVFLVPFAATALVLCNCIYPSTWGIGEPMLLEGLAIALPALHKLANSSRREERDLEEDEVDLKAVLNFAAPSVFPSLSEEEREARVQELFDGVLDFWRRLSAAFEPVRDFLVLLLEEDGRHDASSKDCQHMRRALVAVLQNGWNVAKRCDADGNVTLPPDKGPAAEVAGPAAVLNPQLAPVFFTTETREARGGLCGMQRFQFRQVLALVAACGIADRVQVVRNEGSLTARTCAAADLLRKDGGERAKKGYRSAAILCVLNPCKASMQRLRLLCCSAMQTDSDALGFGCRASKLIASSKQRDAFDQNTLLCLPIVARIQPPLPFARRWQGEMISNVAKKRSLAETSKQQPASAEVRFTRRFFEAAACSALHEATCARFDGIADDMASKPPAPPAPR
jgi:hypothetical protein